jgi:hypothetical protein
MKQAQALARSRASQAFQIDIDLARRPDVKHLEAVGAKAQITR